MHARLRTAASRCRTTPRREKQGHVCPRRRVQRPAGQARVTRETVGSHARRGTEDTAVQDSVRLCASGWFARGQTGAQRIRGAAGCTECAAAG